MPDKIPRSPGPGSLPDAKLTRYVIPNLRNACRILKQLGRQSDGLKAADLARDLGIPVTTTLRIMTTLLLEGLVRKNEGRFELGPVLIQLGHASLAGTEIRELAIPLLQRLTASTQETAHVAIPCDDRALILAVQDGPHPLRATSRPGYLAELHCSSTGKVFLAFLHQSRLAAVLGPTPAARRTPHTLTTLPELKREVARTRRRGYSLDDEEYHLGVRCLAAPVFSSTGENVAAIGITASVVRLPKEALPGVAAQVRAAAAELSQLLGYSPHPAPEASGA